MATIIHRRPAHALRAEAPRGPGGSFDSLTWVGYASLVAAFGFLVFGLRPIADLGEPRLWDWTKVLGMVFDSLRNTAVVALPAALEWGVPGARRLAPWLMRGTVLLALEQLLGPAYRVARGSYVDSQATADAFTYATPLGIALLLAGIAITLVGIAGAWSLSDGLADAGGRPSRPLLVALVVIGTGVVLAAFLPMLGIPSGEMTASNLVTLASNIVSIVLSLVDNALWLVIAARLVTGLAHGGRPRLAWVLGAIAGAGIIGVRLLAAVGTWIPMDVWALIGEGFRFVSTATWILLLLAFAAGLGRGRVRRRQRPRLRHLFIRNPTS